jgi:hypothetical protein
MWPPSVGLENCAHLHVETADVGTVHIELRCDGEPFPRELVRVGNSAAPLPPEGIPILANDLLARGETLIQGDRAESPGAYLWLVLPGELVPTDELEPEMREALQALGYLE